MAEDPAAADGPRAGTRAPGPWIGRLSSASASGARAVNGRIGRSMLGSGDLCGFGSADRRHAGRSVRRGRSHSITPARARNRRRRRRLSRHAAGPGGSRSSTGRAAGGGPCRVRIQHAYLLDWVRTRRSGRSAGTQSAVGPGTSHTLLNWPACASRRGRRRVCRKASPRYQTADIAGVGGWPVAVRRC